MCTFLVWASSTFTLYTFLKCKKTRYPLFKIWNIGHMLYEKQPVLVVGVQEINEDTLTVKIRSDTNTWVWLSEIGQTLWQNSFLMYISLAPVLDPCLVSHHWSWADMDSWACIHKAFNLPTKRTLNDTESSYWRVFSENQFTNLLQTILTKEFRELLN